jgi:hypothetical protein
VSSYKHLRLVRTAIALALLTVTVLKTFCNRILPHPHRLIIHTHRYTMSTVESTLQNTNRPRSFFETLQTRKPIQNCLSSVWDTNQLPPEAIQTPYSGTYTCYNMRWIQKEISANISLQDMNPIVWAPLPCRYTNDSSNLLNLINSLLKKDSNYHIFCGEGAAQGVELARPQCIQRLQNSGSRWNAFCSILPPHFSRSLCFRNKWNQQSVQMCNLRLYISVHRDNRNRLLLLWQQRCNLLAVERRPSRYSQTS